MTSSHGSREILKVTFQLIVALMMLFLLSMPRDFISNMITNSSRGKLMLIYA